MTKLQNLIDDAKRYETVRELRWPEGVTCPHCQSATITKQGFDPKHSARQKYRCSRCQRCFDDLTATVFAGHHQPLRAWIVCLYLMGLKGARGRGTLEKEKPPILRMLERGGQGVAGCWPTYSSRLLSRHCERRSRLGR